MSNDVAVKGPTQLAALSDMADEVFGEMQIDSSDILLPKILLMQPVSGFVGDGKAQIGDYVQSLSVEKVGSILEPFQIIPFYLTKCIDVVNADDGNKLIRKDPFNKETAALPRDDKENGVNIRRYTRMDFFCLVPKLMQGGSVLPAVVSFKSTSYRAGQLIISAWADTQTSNQKAKQEGRAGDMKLPFSKSFELAGQRRENDKKQKYCAMTVAPGPAVTEEQQRMCLQWLATIKSQSVSIKVDNSDDNVAEHVEVADGLGPY